MVEQSQDLISYPANCVADTAGPHRLSSHHSLACFGFPQARNAWVLVSPGAALNPWWTGVGRETPQLPEAWGDNSTRRYSLSALTMRWNHQGSLKCSGVLTPAIQGFWTTGVPEAPQVSLLCSKVWESLPHSLLEVLSRTEPQLPTELTCSWSQAVVASFPSLFLLLPTLSPVLLGITSQINYSHLYLGLLLGHWT